MNRTPISRRMLFTAMTLAAFSVAASAVWAFPEPHVVPTSWELDFTQGKPSLVSVRMQGEDKPRHYYYFTYTVTNRTGTEQLWVPEFSVWTDAGDLIQANRGISPTIFNAIRDREKNPLLENPFQIVGPLLQGTDNARDGVVIWQVPEHDVDHIRIFISGLSGETHVVKDPLSGEEKLLRKTLMLEYRTPGDYAHVLSKPFNFVGKEWVVR